MSGLVELPLNLAGKVYAGPMPFSSHDPKGDLYKAYRSSGVSVVVMLVSDEECLEKTGFDLRRFYVDEGLQVIHVPAADFSVPHRADLEKAVDQVLALARDGKHIAVHCHYGIGRTGLFSAFLGRRALGLSGLEAMFWIRGLIPGALEVPEQVQMLVE